MSKKSIRIVLSLLLICAFAAARLHASDVISVDFVYSGTGIGPVTGDTTPTPGNQSNTSGLIFTGQIGSWNPVTVGGNNVNNTSASGSSFLNGNGLATGVGFSISAPANFHTNYTTTTVPILRHNGSSLSTVAESAYLYPGVLTGTQMTWTISGLTPNALYNLAIFGDGELPNGTTHTANGIAGLLDSQRDWNWSMLSANGSGAIQGIFTAPSPTSGITGFQLQAISVAAVPEPGSLLLWSLVALVGVVVAFGRWRRRS